MLITHTQSNRQKDLHNKPVCLIQAVLQELNLIKKNTVLFSLIFYSNRLHILDHVFFIGDVWLYFSGHINSLKCRVWNNEKTFVFITHPYILKKLWCGDWTALLQEHSWNKYTYIPGVNTSVYCINKNYENYHWLQQDLGSNFGITISPSCIFSFFAHSHGLI